MKCGGLKKKVMCRNPKETSLKNIADHFKLEKILEEDSINLNRNVLGRMKGRFEVRNAKSYFKVMDKFVSPDGDIISSGHMVDLYNSITVNEGINHIVGIKLHYAVRDGIFLIIYQPVLLIPGKKLSDRGKYYLYVEQKNEYHYYEYGGSTGFTIIDKSKAEADIKNYSYSSKIKHSAEKGEDFIDFISCVDTEYAVFSFQEIFNLMYQNKSEGVYMYNAAIKNRHDPYSEIRQSVIVSYKKLNSNKNSWWRRIFLSSNFLTGKYEAEKAFKGRLANLAHLCPPHRDIVFKLEEGITIDTDEQCFSTQEPYFKKNNIEIISDKYLYNANLIIDRYKQEELRNDTTLKGEDKIDLTRNGVRVANAESCIDLCNKYMALGSEKIPDVEPDRIGNMDGALSSIEFYKMRDDLIDRQISQYTDFPKLYVTAVRVHYGVDSTTDPKTHETKQQLIFVYEPILMERGAEMGKRNKLYKYIERPLEDKLFYICNPSDGKFIPKDLIAVNGYKNRYVTQFNFRHYSDIDDCTPHISSLDSQYALITFQEFFNFIWKIESNPRPVSIFSAISWWEHYPAVETRHSILISPNSGVKVDIYGNLAHLCPPHRDIFYRLE